MALTYSAETGTGASKVYDIRWESGLGFLDRSHVYVYTGDDYTQNNLVFTWVNDNQIQLTATNAVNFRIRRVVPRSTAINNYTDGAILREQNLDDSYAQALMILEEVTDGFLQETPTAVLGQILDMLGNRIVNVGTATEPTDAVNKLVTDLLDARQAALEASWQPNSTLLPWNVVPTAGQTVVTLPFSTDDAMVVLNGAFQNKPKGAWELTTANRITFAEPLEEEDDLLIIMGIKADSFYSAGLTSPDGSVWYPSIDNAGVVTYTK